MSKQVRILLNKILMVMFIWAIFGCGATSNNSAAGSKSGLGITNGSSQSLSPGELAKLNNQNTIGRPSDENEELEEVDQITPLYKGLSSRNPTERKNSEKILMNLVTYDPQFLEELKRAQKDNSSPDSWFEAGRIIQLAEKAKKDADDEIINRAIAEGKAESESNSN